MLARGAEITAEPKRSFCCGKFWDERRTTRLVEKGRILILMTTPFHLGEHPAGIDRAGHGGSAVSRGRDPHWRRRVPARLPADAELGVTIETQRGGKLV